MPATPTPTGYHHLCHRSGCDVGEFDEDLRFGRIAVGLCHCQPTTFEVLTCTVHMNVRAFNVNQTTDKTRDVLARNVTVSLNNGTVLLESGELKFAYQRRYGLIGENGVGKSTLLKAIAQGGVEGFPTHLRVLHVRQEVPAHLMDAMSVFDAVVMSDLERNMLVDREKELQAKLEVASGGEDDANLTFEEKRKKLAANASDMKTMEADLKELDGIYARLQILSADSAQARAAMILSGLQFTPTMQAGPISALSGGWKMRVALAAALFIEPDLLMLYVIFLASGISLNMRTP